MVSNSEIVEMAAVEEFKDFPFHAISPIPRHHSHRRPVSARGLAKLTFGNYRHGHGLAGHVEKFHAVAIFHA